MSTADAGNATTAVTPDEIVEIRFSPTTAMADDGVLCAGLPEDNRRGETEQQQPTSGAGEDNQGGSSSPALDFLDDVFGMGKRHLVAIKKGNGKNEIKARHFDAADRAGQQAFIADNGKAGFDLYFTPNPIKGTLHKKARKNDVVEARHLWVDLDPRKTEPLEAERAAMLARLTTELPDGLPRPNREIDRDRKSTRLNSSHA